MSGNFAIKGGGVRPLMANAILNFHFDFLTPSLILNHKDWGKRLSKKSPFLWALLKYLLSLAPQAIKATPPPQTILLGLFTLWRSRQCGQKKLRAAFHWGASLNSGKQVLFTDRDPVRWYESSKNTISKLYKLITSPAITINPLCQVNSWMADGDLYKWGDQCLGNWLISITWVQQTFLYYSNF